MVEFALVGPILMALLFGVIEFSWTFNQVLDVRHGAREGARLAAVNFSPTGVVGDAQTALIVATICNRVDAPEEVRVSLELATAGADQPGDVGRVRVERDLDQLTGFYDQFLGNFEPNSTSVFMLEQEASWNPTSTPQSCPVTTP